MKKENSTALLNKADTGVITSVSFWAIMVRVFNALPLDPCHCETEADARQYVKVAILFLSVFMLAGMYDAMMGGGAL